MSAVPDNPTPPPPRKGARLGELLIAAGLLTHDQLEQNLAIHRATGKPLGHVLVENQVVHAHSIAMALADQHGGPLKTEFGFAVGRLAGSINEAGAEDSALQPRLRLALRFPSLSVGMHLTVQGRSTAA